jgi:S-DNA-T family DNA segregation ATPase FtsK/SpoIIIE
VTLATTTGPDDDRPAEVERLVLDAELVDEAAPRRPIVQAATVARRQTVHVVTTLRQHEPTVQSARLVLATGLTVVQGVESWGRRAWDGSTMGTYRRAIRAAEAAGDREALADWADRKERATDLRHKRLMDLPRLAVGLVKALLGGIAGLVALVLVVALLAQLTGTGSFVGVLAGVVGAIGWRSPRWRSSGRRS